MREKARCLALIGAGALSKATFQSSNEPKLNECVANFLYCGYVFLRSCKIFSLESELASFVPANEEKIKAPMCFIDNNSTYGVITEPRHRLDVNQMVISRRSQ
ncbi:hypothetical protein M8C21_010897 [Ambrosia artemisiifolia]|uniref:Uncharacterized protein n=1 Tax=Ambrosia artemisiifolia TaxID=4212 RepID=A0AAD5CXD6_AMBAR|nr:hypothetical protein M8C21_010897 [Ambrosia artemisiifolia]